MKAGAGPALRFSFEWESGEGVRSPELAATWASFQIWAGDDCVTTVEDLRSASARRSINCSMYPVAEWVAFNWWYLQANQRPAVLEPHSFFEPTSELVRFGDSIRHHLLREAGDGFVYPDLAIVPQGSSVRLLWKGDAEFQNGSPIRYIGSGDALVSREGLVATLGELVEAVLTRLREQGVHDTPLEQEWATVTSADPDEREFCWAAARLGMDAYAIDPKLAKVVEKADELLDPVTRDDLLDAVPPTAGALASALVWLKRLTERTERWHGKASGEIAGLRADPPTPRSGAGLTPWSQGYEQARLVRSALGVAPAQRLDPDRLLTSGRSESPAQELQGFGAITAKGAPALILSKQMKARAVRFAEARALWNFVYGEDGDRFLLTTARGERQQAERAFAAELLAPSEGLRAELDREPTMVSEEEVDDLADHFGVSPLVIDHQLENQLGATVL